MTLEEFVQAHTGSIHRWSETVLRQGSQNSGEGTHEEVDECVNQFRTIYTEQLRKNLKEFHDGFNQARFCIEKVLKTKV